MSARSGRGRSFGASGGAEGAVLRLSEPLSFWGGFDPETGRILDHSHPEVGAVITGRILALPGLRGSAGTPGCVAEAVRRGSAPIGFITPAPDVNLAVGLLVAERLYGLNVPALALDPPDFDALPNGALIRVDGGHWALEPAP